MVEIQKPRIECIENVGDDSYGKYVVEPLERGYGTTLGNSLRRILLSSLPGTAVTTIKIAGVQHEFSTIPGVKEDVTEIVLNVKGIIAKLHSEGVKTVYIEASGAGTVTAGDIKADGEVELALSLRQELAKSSVKKYTAMQTVVGSDNRARGLIQFYGANRTGRYAGRLIQVQNLPQNHLPDLDIARALVRSGNTDAVEMLYDSVPLVLSELIRTAFVPKPGCRFYVADFSAIEARVIAWIAGEHWRQEVFAKGGDIYCASASQMFHVPVEKHGVNGHLRQKGKIAELALGYGGSVGALKAMGALNYGLQEEELKPLVDAWRLSNPHITKFWWDADKAASTCVRERTVTETHSIRFYYQSGMMFVVLPSGRRLVYVKPKMDLNRFGNESVTYEGVGEQKKWLRLESYGPKFVENIVQATARDILAEAMLRLNAAGYRIVMHVHDEAVIEAPPDTSLENICSVMGQTPTWASGLLLRADGYVCDFYKKD